MKFFAKHKGDLVMIAFFSVLCIAIPFIDLMPKVERQPGEKVRALVLDADNTHLERRGVLTSGFQTLKVRILSGTHKGAEFTAANQLRSQMELDKLFKPGDIILAGIPADSQPGVDIINAQDHYRVNLTIWLFALFALLLIAFGGLIGLKALISFIFTCQVIWFIMVPLCLKGFNPIIIAMLIVVILSAAIIYIVAGFTPTGHTAFAGAFSGVLASCIMAIFFTNLFRINGAGMPYAQALYYSGYEFLDLAALYTGAICLAASGAVMDLGMDVAVGMREVVQHHRSISRNELIKSGLRIGRSVVGTMTTTLLLAYSGGYLTLMMTFAANGVHPVDFINNPHVAGEIVKTIIGSFGLVLVAPFTAIIGGFILVRRRAR